MQQYALSFDNSEQNRIIIAKKTLAIGEQQPLIRVYSNTKAFNGIIGLSADKLPNEFAPALYDAAHYWPDKITSFYYLIKQCDAKGTWNASDWEYYEQLNNYYPDNIVTYSILLSMTTRCAQVSDVVYQQCQEHYSQSDRASLCAVPASKAKSEN